MAWMKSEEYEKADGLKKSENSNRRVGQNEGKGATETDLQQSSGPTSPSESKLFSESVAGPTSSRVLSAYITSIEPVIGADRDRVRR